MSDALDVAFALAVLAMLAWLQHRVEILEQVVLFGAGVDGQVLERLDVLERRDALENLRLDAECKA